MKPYTLVCSVLCALLVACGATRDQVLAHDIETGARTSSGDILSPGLKVVRAQLPEFPRAAMLGGLEGEVVAEILFDTTGEFKEVRILSSPHKVLTDAVAVAVSRWRIEPYVNSDGRPIEIAAKQTFIFKKE